MLKVSRGRVPQIEWQMEVNSPFGVFVLLDYNYVAVVLWLVEVGFGADNCMMEEWCESRRVVSTVKELVKNA